MKIRKDTWHARAYRFWQRSISTKHQRSYYRNDWYETEENWQQRINTTTLCQYFWVVVLRAPFRWLFQGSVTIKQFDVPAPVFWVTAALSMLIGWGLANYTAETVRVLLYLLGFVVAFVAIVLFSVWMEDEGVDKWKAWRARRREQDHEESEPDENSFGYVIRERLKAKKQKVCPILELVDDPIDKPTEV